MDRDEMKEKEIKGEKVNRKKKENKKKRKEKKRERKAIMDISSFYLRYTARRSCFAKRFPKTDSAPPQNPLY
jgi:hypothetical protein